jgi:hypothetical protein
MGGITTRHWLRLVGSLADDDVVSDTASVRGLLRHHLAHVDQTRLSGKTWCRRWELYPHEVALIGV